METTLKESEEELKRLEETPLYMSTKDGMPNPMCILFIISTGVIMGLIIIWVYRAIKKYKLKEKIKQLKRNGLIQNEH